jgi:phage/plasmid-like protein (TIGR03299 family)
MSAELENMFYLGADGVPWHGLGTKLDKVATAQEAIIAAGLDWEVELRSAFTTREGGIYIPVPGKHVVVRKTDDSCYNIVSKQYTPVQNREAFDFFDSVVGTGEAKYHTAGSLRGGGIVWILAQVEGLPIVIAKDVHVEKYILLANSHNGQLAFQMFWTPINVVCMNTLKMALGGGGERFYARHLPNIAAKLDMARQVLGLAGQFYAKWEEQAKYLVDYKLTGEALDELLMHAFDVAHPDKPGPIFEREKAKVLAVMEKGRGMDNPAIKDSAWKAYNALVEYVDYYREFGRGINKGDDQRLYGAWFGSGDEIKQRAWSHLLTAKN